MLKRKRKTKRIPLQLKRHPAINIGKKITIVMFLWLADVELWYWWLLWNALRCIRGQIGYHYLLSYKILTFAK